MIARATMLALALGAFSVVPVASRVLPPQLLPIYGGTGGTAFTRSCGDGKVLSGLRFRGGMMTDALGVLCRPVLAGGALGPESTVGTLAGGNGGTAGSVSCPSGSAATGAHINHGSLVNSVRLLCQPWDAASRSFVGSRTTATDYAGGNGGSAVNIVHCEAATQPANGIRGRAQLMVDAVGFICDEP